MQEILFLGSNPPPYTRLDLLKQYAEIQAAVYSNPARQFSLRLAYAVPGDDLAKVLARHQPVILHYTGHANKDALFVNDPANSYYIEADIHFVGELLEALPVRPRCVVLNACHTADPPDAFQEAVDFVIGMDGKVHEESATTFAGAFYTDLARGATVGDAFDMGKAQMRMIYKEESAIPRLSGRARESAWKTTLTEPAIAAEFVLDRRGAPKKTGERFDVRLWIRNAPATTDLAIYQLTRSAGRKEFVKVEDRDQDFKLRINCLGALEAKATLWSTFGGICLKRSILEALRETHQKPTSEIAKALNELQYV